MLSGMVYTVYCYNENIDYVWLWQFCMCCGECKIMQHLHTSIFPDGPFRLQSIILPVSSSVLSTHRLSIKALIWMCGIVKLSIVRALSVVTCSLGKVTEKYCLWAICNWWLVLFSVILLQDICCIVVCVGTVVSLKNSIWVPLFIVNSN